MHSHVHVDDITAEQAVSLMVAFYRQVHNRDCPLNEAGDMLHYEWGLYHCGGRDLFHFELSRLFIELENEDGMSQLTLALHYEPTFTLRTIKSGDHWCPSRAGADEFERCILSSEACWAVSTIPPDEVALEWNRI